MGSEYVPSLWQLTVTVFCFCLVLESAELCESPWQRAEDNCYLHNETQLSFADASASCQAQGSELASISSNSINLFLKNFADSTSERLWIGLECQGGGTCSNSNLRSRRLVWGWLDGAEYNIDTIFNKWRSAEPATNERCGYLGGTGLWYGANCDNAYEFICQKAYVASNGTNELLDMLSKSEASMKDLDTKDPTPFPEYEGGPCPCGWIADANGENCFLSHEKKGSFSKAKSLCSEEGAKLATIKSKGDSYVAKKLAEGKNHWIGFECRGSCNDKRRAARRRLYKWLDNTKNGYPKGYSNWGRSKPMRGKLCGVVQGDGKWNGKPCHSKLQPLCSKAVEDGVECNPAPIETDDCLNREMIFNRIKELEQRFIDFAGLLCGDTDSIINDKCYSILTKPLTFDDAREACLDYPEGDLACLGNSKENEAVADILTAGDTHWIGLQCKSRCDAFQRWERRNSYSWVDGTKYNYKSGYTSWMSTAPNKEDDCGLLKKDGKWYGKPCTEEHLSICEYAGKPAYTVADFETDATSGDNVCPSLEELEERLGIFDKIMEEYVGGD